MSGQSTAALDGLFRGQSRLGQLPGDTDGRCITDGHMPRLDLRRSIPSLKHRREVKDGQQPFPASMPISVKKENAEAAFGPQHVGICLVPGRAVKMTDDCG